MLILHYLAASFTLTGQAQIKEFLLESVVSKLCEMTHFNTEALCVMGCLLYTPFPLLSFYPNCTLLHTSPTPIFTVWTCTDCGQQSMWDNGDCQM